MRCGELCMFQLFQSLHVCPSFARTHTRSLPLALPPTNFVPASCAADTGIETFTPCSAPSTVKCPLPALESQNSYCVIGSLSASLTLKSEEASTAWLRSTVWSEALTTGAALGTWSAVVMFHGFHALHSRPSFARTHTRSVPPFAPPT